MRPLPQRRIDPKALIVWRIKGIIGTLALAFFPLTYISVAAFGFLPLPPRWILLIIAILLLLFAVFTIIIVPSLRLRYWRYEVTEHEIDLYYGVFIRRRTLIPMIKVQHVDTKEGPLFRYYKLATVMISTAATTHEIPALLNETADGLRDKISTLAMVVDEDV